ncbi:MAG: VWA domain-containing protein, partial [Deltaproteobacteria bacterium]|nr:VWA domain-containing protein [Deltaproteobacteria bacterium]
MGVVFESMNKDNRPKEFSDSTKYYRLIPLIAAPLIALLILGLFAIGFKENSSSLGDLYVVPDRYANFIAESPKYGSAAVGQRGLLAVLGSKGPDDEIFFGGSTVGDSGGFGGLGLPEFKEESGVIHGTGGGRGKMIKPQEGYAREKSVSHQNFIPAKGYFRNTYLPGDPELESLRRSLEQNNYFKDEKFSLAKAVIPYRQPFDAPESEGLAVYLSADHTALEGPTRMTVQVGLKGSERHARRRASLNAALVVDLRQVPEENERRILWSLVDAMAADLQAGDRFYLILAGTKDCLRVKPADFNQMIIRRSLADGLEQIERSGSQGNLLTALYIAYRAVGGEAANDAPIGANLVVIASAADLGAELEPLQMRVHQGSLKGITLTTIGVGREADIEALRALAMAGQGRRRFVDNTKKAQRTIEEELSASGRVVARAVRLRIRLAKGVRLV